MKFIFRLIGLLWCTGLIQILAMKLRLRCSANFS